MPRNHLLDLIQNVYLLVIFAPVEAGKKQGWSSSLPFSCLETFKSEATNPGGGKESHTHEEGG